MSNIKNYFYQETGKFYMLNKSHNWTFLQHEFFSLPSSLHEFFFMSFSHAWILVFFLVLSPTPPITFVMVRPLAWRLSTESIIVSFPSFSSISWSAWISSLGMIFGVANGGSPSRSTINSWSFRRFYEFNRTPHGSSELPWRLHVTAWGLGVWMISSFS